MKLPNARNNWWKNGAILKLKGFKDFLFIALCCTLIKKVLTALFESTLTLLLVNFCTLLQE